MFFSLHSPQSPANPLVHALCALSVFFVVPKHLLAALLLAAWLPAAAAPVTPTMAQHAAERWATTPQLALTAPFSAKQVTSLWQEDSPDGNPLFYCVEFGGSGFVVTSADDTILPVVAFSGTGRLNRNSNNPLWTLLTRDLAQRTLRTQLGALTLGAPSSSSGPVHAALNLGAPSACSGPVNAARALWQALTSPTAMPLSLESIPDVRVPPLLESTWNQGNFNGKLLYNYYTPYNYVCGCVATAMAQIMRYHQHPQTAVTPVTRTCYLEDWESPLPLTLLGGIYNWSAMVLKPGYSITDTQREAIGRLTYDAGVAVYMNYAEWGSGANSGMAAEALRNLFGYQSARALSRVHGINTAEWRRAIIPNLDGGYPAMLGISNNANVGHAVVADGYGYAGADLYFHLNMGWSGADDVWYNLPTVDEGEYNFNLINTVVYNIYPDESGESVSGRLTLNNTNPLTGVTVTAKRGNENVTTTTNQRGIYAFRLSGVGTPYNITATWGGRSKSASAQLQSSISTTYEEPIWFYDNTGKIGNSWGNNLTFDSPLLQPSEILSTRIISYYGLPCIELEFAALGGLSYAIERTTTLTSPNWVAIVWDNPPVDGTRQVIIALPQGTPQCFYRVVVWE